MKRIAVVAGDGIGREVIPSAVTVLKRVLGAENLQFIDFDYGAERTLRTGQTISDEQIAELGDHDAILLGALGDPRIADNRHAKDILLGLRTKLDLYINFRPCLALADRVVPLKGKHAKDVQFVVFRENTEGLYTGVGGNFKVGTNDEVAIEQEINTHKGVERILRSAFEYTVANQLGRLVMADKANAMSHGHALWRRCFKKLSGEYAGIEARALYVDNLVFQLVQNPAQFSVIVTNNLFGDIVTDLAAALQGGLGLAASVNYRPGGAALFEPVHGSAPDIAGKGIANPLGAILTAALLLDHLGEAAAAKGVNQAVARVLANENLTPDLGGSATTAALTARVLAEL